MTDTDSIPQTLVKQAIDKRQQKILQVDPMLILSAINPRSLEELEWESLLPKVLSERGIFTTPLLLMKLAPDAPEWETMANSKFAEMSTEERSKAFIAIQGHRRTAVAQHIKTSREKFPADIVDNVNTVPAIVLSGITLERAEDLAMDDEAKKTLKKWETIRVVLRRYRKDHRRADIAIDIPQLLYRALLGNGEARYTETSLMDDGTERNKKYVKDLRNPMDTYIWSAFCVGPAVEQQLLYHVKKNGDKRPLLENQRLILDCRYEYIQKLREVYNRTKDESWSPVTRLDIDEASGEPIIEGGNEAVRAWLKLKMLEFRNPELREKKVQLPNKTDRENAKVSARSEAHKLAAAFFCGLPSEGRQEADDKAFFREQREAKRVEIFSTMSEPVQALINAENTERDMAKVEAAYRNVDNIIREAVEARRKIEGYVDEIKELSADVTTLKAEIVRKSSKRSK